MRKNLAMTALFCVPLIAGCASGSLSKRETGALGGGALGAGAGALIGHATGHTAGGAAIGGALGALTGRRCRRSAAGSGPEVRIPRRRASQTAPGDRAAEEAAEPESEQR